MSQQAGPPGSHPHGTAAGMEALLHFPLELGHFTAPSSWERNNLKHISIIQAV